MYQQVNWLGKNVFKMRSPYLVENLLQLILQLHKIVGSDQTVLDCFFTASGQLNQLELNELQGTGGPGQVAVRVLCH